MAPTATFCASPTPGCALPRDHQVGGQLDGRRDDVGRPDGVAVQPGLVEGGECALAGHQLRAEQALGVQDGQLDGRRLRRSAQDLVQVLLDGAQPDAGDVDRAGVGQRVRSAVTGGDGR